MSESPWPFLASVAVCSFLMSGYAYFCGVGSYCFFLLSTLGLSLVSFMWWRDVVRESTLQGAHTHQVCSGLYLGVILFITSEVMFFFSFFFSFFSLSLSPGVEIGSNWPPVGVVPIPFDSVPLINTLLLLSSGVSVTWAHHSLLSSKGKDLLMSLGLTCFLGVLFLFLQGMEYYESQFTMADSAYGSVFFLMTGFHGLHVLVGGVFLFICLLRACCGHFSSNHHLGFEAAAWYWHFVDVVWLGLFISVYWWGS